MGLVEQPADGASATAEPRATVEPTPSSGTRRFRRSVQGLVPVNEAIVVPSPPKAHRTIPDPDAPRRSDYPTPHPSALVAPVRLAIDLKRSDHVAAVFNHFDAFFTGRSLTDLVRLGEALGAWRQSSATAEKETQIIGTLTRLMHGLELEISRDDLHHLLLKYLDPTRLHSVAQASMPAPAGSARLTRTG
ncbi:hypothetical protein LBMAG53_36530 [Planctomycetota bacterium]|nr:hypothetical protein LBMAG53_36530 [Planctomycetota bacterium]